MLERWENGGQREKKEKGSWRVVIETTTKYTPYFVQRMGAATYKP